MPSGRSIRRLKIHAVLPIREFGEEHYLAMATSQGVIKRTPLADFSRPRANGIIALDLREDDYLVNVAVTDGARDVMLFSNTGKAIRFKESDVRPMGRTACGVRGTRLAAGQRVIALIIVEEGSVLTATENGYGKRTLVADYPVHGRGGQGVISIQSSERNGEVVGAVLVQDEDEIMLISNAGTLVRTRVQEISVLGRNTQGVRLISLHNGEKLVGVERIVDVQDDTDDLPAEDDGGQAE